MANGIPEGYSDPDEGKAVPSASSGLPEGYSDPDEKESVTQPLFAGQKVGYEPQTKSPGILATVGRKYLGLKPRPVQQLPPGYSDPDEQNAAAGGVTSESAAPPAPGLETPVRPGVPLFRGRPMGEVPRTSGPGLAGGLRQGVQAATGALSTAAEVARQGLAPGVEVARDIGKQVSAPLGPQAAQTAGAATGQVAEIVGQMATDPAQVALMAGMGGLPVPVGKFLLSVFMARGAKGAADDVTDLAQNWDQYAPEERGKRLGSAAANAAMALGPAGGMARGALGAKAETLGAARQGKAAVAERGNQGRAEALRVIGLPGDAPPEAVDAKSLEILKATHPDNFSATGGNPAAEDVFKRTAAARDFLRQTPEAEIPKKAWQEHLDEFLKAPIQKVKDSLSKEQPVVPPAPGVPSVYDRAGAPGRPQLAPEGGLPPPETQAPAPGLAAMAPAVAQPAPPPGAPARVIIPPPPEPTAPERAAPPPEPGPKRVSARADEMEAQFQEENHAKKGPLLEQARLRKEPPTREEFEEAAKQEIQDENAAVGERNPEEGARPPAGLGRPADQEHGEAINAGQGIPEHGPAPEDAGAAERPAGGRGERGAEVPAGVEHPQRDLIEKIVAAARKPRAEIVPSTELKFTDGKWYGIGGPPNPGTRMAEPVEKRVVGYVFRAKDGTTYGKRFATPEEAHAWQDTNRAKTDTDLREALQKETPEALQRQATYWLKEKPPLSRLTNPFREKAIRARAQADALNRPTAHEQGMAEAFPLGAGFGHPGAARRIDRSVDRSVEAVKATKDAEFLESSAQLFDEGKINAQGRSLPQTAEGKARLEKAATGRQSRQERIAAAQEQRAGREPWETPQKVYADASGQLAGSGRKLVESDHRIAVEQALADGKPVPTEVLADYPDLTKAPARTADTMSDAIALSSPSGGMSKRARAAAEERLRKDLFGPEGLKRPEQEQPSERETLLRRAKELRGLAERGMSPRLYTEKAVELEARAAGLVESPEEAKGAVPKATPGPSKAPPKSREDIRREAVNAGFGPPEQVDAVMKVLDRTAEYWAKQNPGKKPEDFFPEKMAGVTKGAPKQEVQYQHGIASPTFFSQAIRTIEDKMPNAASPGQVRGILSPQNGVKPEELEWVGLDDVLRGKLRVTKQEVLDHLRANQVVVKPLVRGSELGGKAKEAIDKLEAAGYQVFSGGGGGLHIERDGIDVGGPEGLPPELRDAASMIAEAGGIEELEEENLMPKFDRYTLPGGTNYREVLLQKADVRGDAIQERIRAVDKEIDQAQLRSQIAKETAGGESWNRYEELRRERRRLYAELKGDTPEAMRLLDEREKVGEKMMELSDRRVREGKTQSSPGGAHIDKDPEYRKLSAEFSALDYDLKKEQARTVRPPEPFTSSHWDEPNVLAHLRLNDRVDATGKKVLFIEEIQSDWGAHNRRALAEITQPDSVRKLGQNVFGSQLSAVMPLNQMDGGVLSTVQHEQVQRAIISSLPIEVVNDLATVKATPKELFSDPDMVVSRLPVDHRHSVAKGLLSAMRGVGATLRTKLLDARHAGADVDLLPALKASDLSTREVVGVLSPERIYHVGLHGGSALSDVAGAGAEALANPRETTRGSREQLAAGGAGRRTERGEAGSRTEGTAPPTRADVERFAASPADIANWHAQILAKKGVSKQGSVIPGPFVTKPGAYAELATKWALRHAVENGYDKVAWATGEQQTERYDLSKQVDTITYRRSALTHGANEKGWLVSAEKNGREAIPGNRVPDAELERTVGKEIAAKIRAGDGKYPGKGADPDARQLSGLDLKVGGEGMKGFYDQILPATVNKYVKKWGGRVQEAGSTEGPNAPNIITSKSDAGRYRVHMLSITPAMRESVMQGQPLFQKGHVLAFRAAQKKQAAADRATVRRLGRRLMGGTDPRSFRERMLDDMWDAVKGKRVEYLDKPAGLTGYPTAEERAREPEPVPAWARSVTEAMSPEDFARVAQEGLGPTWEGWKKGGKLFFQGGEYPKAAISMLEDGRALIHAMKNPDISSLLHEATHLFETTLSAEDRASVEEAYGKGWSTTREGKEKFAEDGEAYFADGKSPTPQMKGVFEKFKAWLTDIYRSIKNTILGREIHPKIREVFDKWMRGGEEATTAAESLREGKEGRITMEDGEKVPFRYGVIEAGGLVTSHNDDLSLNPKARTELQGRDRSKGVSHLQVAAIEKNPDFDRLEASPTPDTGAPLVNRMGETMGGQGRGIGIRRSYRAGKAGEYRATLEKRAADFGLDPGEIAGMKEPVLVRVAGDVKDEAAFAEKTNVSAGLSLSASEKGRQDSKKLTPAVLDIADPEADLAAPRNAAFVGRFINELVPKNERGPLLDEKTGITPEGVQRVRAALIASAYGDTPPARRLLEELPEDTRSIQKALVDAAPAIASAQVAMKAGDVQQVDFTGPILETADLLHKMAVDGVPLKRFLEGDPRDPDLLSVERGPETDRLLTFFEANKRKPKEIVGFLRALAATVQTFETSKTASLFGDEFAKAPPTQAEVYELARRAYDEVKNDQLGLYPDETEPGPPEGPRSADAEGTPARGGAVEEPGGQEMERAPREAGAARATERGAAAEASGAGLAAGPAGKVPAEGDVGEPEERFAASDASTGIFNDIFGTREPGRKTQTRETDPLAASRPEVEERLAAAEKGLASPTVLEKVKAAGASVTQSFRRHFRHIDSGESQAMALNQDILRQYEAAPQYAKKVASDSLAYIVEGLDKDGLKVFRRILALQDLVRSVEEGLYDEKDLPFGYESLEEAKADLAKYETVADLKANPALKRALARREKLATELTERLVDQDLLSPDVLKDSRYYHRQVLAYFNMRDPQFIGTGSGEVRLHRKGFQKERVGGSDFNMKYQEAEFEWMSQAYSLLQTSETLQRLEGVNNIAPGLRAQAKHLNEVTAFGGIKNWNRAQEIRGELASIYAMGETDRGTNEIKRRLQDELSKIDPLYPFRTRKAAAIRDLETLAEDGKLDHVPPEHQEAVSRLGGMHGNDFEDGGFGADDQDLGAGFFPLLNYLVGAEGKPGAGPAARFFKAVADQTKFIKETAGKDFKTFEDLIPDRHPAAPQNRAVVWQPEKGNRFYLARTFPERALSRLEEALEKGVPGVSAEDVRAFMEKGREALVSGGKKEEWVIPENLAKTLDDWNHGRIEEGFEKAQGDLLTSWKQWVLLNPVRALKYNLNNESGDLDAVMAAYPGALKELSQSARDLWGYDVKENVSNRALVAELHEAMKRGVIGSGQSFQEIPDINRVGAFRALTSEDPNVVQKALQQYWAGTKKFSTWRENVLRLAVYRHLLKRLRLGEEGLYGASRPGEVRAVSDPEDRAAKLSRELLGDYGNISVAGQYVRRHMIPFYSWMEINLPRYVRMFRNAAREEGGGGDAGGAAKRGATVAAFKTARFALTASLFYAAVQAWNSLVFPEEEKKLGRDRRQLHLILGKAKDGTIHSIRLQGALSDALDWFGLGNVVSDVKDLRADKKTWKDQAVEALKAPIDKIIQGWEPLTKTMFELRSGTRSYPSIFKEGSKWEFANRPIRDRAEYLGDTAWPLGALYRRVTGKPKRPAMDLGIPGAGPLIESLLVYKTDPGEASYWAAQDLVRRWKDSQGKGGGGAPQLGGETKKRSDALYYFRKASEWGDDAAAKKWLQEYFDNGGTMRSITSHILHASPISGLSLGERPRFRASLRPEDQALLKEAQEWSDKGRDAMRRKLGERTFTVPARTPRVPSVYLGASR